MKLRNLIIAVGMFASTCAFADTKAEAMGYADSMLTLKSEAQPEMETGWNSPECVFTAEADEPELREFAIKTIVPHIDKNRAMTFESYGFKDTLIAIQMVVCEGKTPQEAVNFVDPE